MLWRLLQWLCQVLWDTHRQKHMGAGAVVRIESGEIEWENWSDPALLQYYCAVLNSYTTDGKIALMQRVGNDL